MTQLAPDETTATRKDDVVVLVVPADGSYLAVLRTATAGLAARLQFTLDEIEDDHLDELSASAYHYTDGHLRLHGQAGAWYDEDETGGAAAGCDVYL